MRFLPRTRFLPKTLWACLLLPLSLSLAGCNDPYARLRTQRRTERAQRWIQRGIAREADGWNRLGYTVDLLGRLHNRTVERANRIPAKIARWQEREEGGFRAREPWHRAWISKSVSGDLDRAHRSAIKLIH